MTQIERVRQYLQNAFVQSLNHTRAVVHDDRIAETRRDDAEREGRCRRRMHDARLAVDLLGDIIHGSRMSEGAAGAVRGALKALRDVANVTLVAGNHEGRSRGAAILGETVESAVRDGWLLLHGDRPVTAAALSEHEGVVIGHLHPSMALGGGASAPAFLSSDRLIVLPAMTPYSDGLNVFSDDCLRALAPFNVDSRRELEVIAAAGDLLYPFGALSSLRRAVFYVSPTPRPSRFRRKFLRPD